MIPTLEELGRRAVACKAWYWMPGILDEDGDRVSTMDNGRDRELAGLIPDLSDPATLGCLLHLVREAWGGAPFHVEATHGPNGPGWRLQCGNRFQTYVCATEAHALVAALEAAP